MGPSYLSDLAVDDIFFSKGTCCQLKQDSFDAGLIGESKQTEQQQKSNITVHLAWNAIGIYFRVLLINMCIAIGFSRIVHLRKGNVTDTIKIRNFV